MNIKIFLLLMGVGIVGVAIVLSWTRNLPKSALNFFGLLLVLAFFGVGLLYLKHRLTRREGFN